MHYNTVVVIDSAEDVNDAASQGQNLLAPFDESLRMESFSFLGMSPGGVERATESYVEEFADSDPEPAADIDAHVEWTARAVGWHETDDPKNGVYEAGAFGIISNHNPNSKWDSWTLGGRWGGWFPVNEGVHFSEYGLGYPDGQSTPLNRLGYADIIQVKNFNYHQKIRESADKAAQEYGNFLRATHGMDYGLTYEELAEKHAAETGINVLSDLSKESEPVRRAVRQEWFSQDFVQFNNSIGGTFREDPHEYWCINTGGRHKYILDRINKATAPHAFLRDEAWEERLGGEEERPAWVQKSYEILTELNPDSWVMMVDCHT